MVFLIFQGACLVLLLLHAYYCSTGDAVGALGSLIAATVFHLIAWAGLLLEWLDRRKPQLEKEENWS